MDTLDLGPSTEAYVNGEQRKSLRIMRVIQRGKPGVYMVWFHYFLDGHLRTRQRKWLSQGHIVSYSRGKIGTEVLLPLRLFFLRSIWHTEKGSRRKLLEEFHTEVALSFLTNICPDIIPESPSHLVQEIADIPRSQWAPHANDKSSQNLWAGRKVQGGLLLPLWEIWNSRQWLSNR